MVKSFFWIGITLIAGLILTLLPLPDWAVWFRPEWLAMVVLYWCLALPNRISVGMAWMSGLFLDVINGTLLGEHAIAMAIIAYITVKNHRRIRLFPLWQQALTILGLIFLMEMVIFIIQAVIGQMPRTLLYWLPCITSMVLWPWMFVVLRDWRRRFGVK